MNAECFFYFLFLGFGIVLHLVCCVNIGFLVYAEPIILSRFEAKGLELCAEVSR